ncbi:MAG: nodulin 21 [Moraxellaceae bacterium]|jgi:VIT1/CCC1 family predicted Fe2+/Mn2+ transporter|nr:nodulin 21 [Moraxellaceae bacterium]
MPRLHLEFHKSDRIGWLRAAVLGANDGTISTASLVVGVAAAGASQGTLLLTGVAGLVAGAMSMAAGEYVSVMSQSDTENADLARERGELESQPEHELDELTEIYASRGLDAALARQVAVQMTAHNALEAHARDELGITETLRARPVQASLASAASFALGASVPIITVLLAPGGWAASITTAASLLTLLVLGGLAAAAGGASVTKGAVRVAFWGALAMAASAAVGQLFGATL